MSLSPQPSVSKYGEEEAGDVLFLALKDDGAIFASLRFPPHQVEKLVEAHKIVIEGLRLEGSYDASAASRPIAATQHALIHRIVVVVLAIIIVRLSWMLHDQIVLLLLNIHLVSIFVCEVTNRALASLLAYLSNLGVRDEGNRAELVRGDHLGRI